MITPATTPNTVLNISVESILAADNAEPAKPVPMSSDSLLPTVVVLRDEKHLSWIEISAWVKAQANLYRSTTFWTNAYNKVKGVKKSARKRAKVSTTPVAVSAEPSTSPVAA